MSTTTEPFSEFILADKINDLYAQRTDLSDEGQSIVNLAEKESNREFTDAERTRLEKITEEYLPKVNDKIESVEKINAQKMELAKARVLANMPPDGGPDGPSPLNTAIDKHYARPRATRIMSKIPDGMSPNEAQQVLWLGGQWLKNEISQAMNRGPDQLAIDRLTEAGWIRNQQVIGSDLLGGNLTPKPLSQMLVDNREDIGITRQLVDIVAMSANTQDVPKAGSGLTVYAPGEATAITGSTYNTSQINLVALKRAVLNQLSSEVSDDAIMSMTDRSIREMGRALALQEDFELVNGDGTAPPNQSFGVTGLITGIADPGGVYTTAATNTSWDDITATDVSKWLGLLPSQYGDGTTIICSREFYWSVLMRIALELGGTSMTAAQSGPLNSQSRVGGFYMGIPCVFTSQMPQATAVNTIHALYGNFMMSAMLGDRNQSVAISVDFDFDKDVTTLRGTSRYDIKVHEGDPAGDGSLAGGYVGIRTAAV